MKFRSEIKPREYGFGISHEDRVFFSGSCFAGMIGGRLRAHKFNVHVNPFGIIYHPVPLLRPLIAALEGDLSLSENPFLHLGKWRSLAFHSELSFLEQNDFKNEVKQKLKQSGEFLKQANVVILTLGTAIGQVYRATGAIAGNCHKLPASDFRMEISDIVTIQNQIQHFLDVLKYFNAGCRVLLSVSPVRHLRSGIEENAMSKAILRVACGNITSKNEQADYFPAYEIMMDDLRDYRFYKDDLMHPSAFAEDYIWEKFCDSFFAQDTYSLVREIRKIIRDLEHRPSEPGSESHLDFLKKVLARIEALPGEINFEEEMLSIQRQIDLAG